MATIKIVGEDWCPFTQGKTDGEPAEQGAWLQAAALSGAQGDKNITYEKLDCKAASAADKTKYCDKAEGFPSFMDSEGNTCTRGFDRNVGFGDGTDAGVTKTIQDKMGSGTTCA